MDRIDVELHRGIFDWFIYNTFYEPNKLCSMRDIKVGDKLIPDDDFIAYTGTSEFEVLEVKEFKSTLFIGGTALDIKLGGIVPVIGSIYGDFREYRTLKTIDNLYGKYCKAIFFTSEDEKKEWTNRFNEMKMNQHLHMARQYGYEG
jgi:hypothetical protein